MEPAGDLPHCEIERGGDGRAAAAGRRFGERAGRGGALDMVATTLIAMEKGGMNDQLGGGFHRYSVDEYWFVPHFEKMLYDQA
jgi:uncharacterized protein YyaL (SSP411 family)